jgi:hypothetical protein
MNSESQAGGPGVDLAQTDEDILQCNYHVRFTPESGHLAKK